MKYLKSFLMTLATIIGVSVTLVLFWSLIVWLCLYHGIIAVFLLVILTFAAAWARIHSYLWPNHIILK